MSHSRPLRKAIAVVRRALAGLGRLSSAHGLFLLVVVGAVAVRRVAVLGYPSVLWFGDSAGYLESAVRLRPSELRPGGYSLFLWLLEPAHSLRWVVVVQHALGVAIGVLVYVLVWRAARAALPSRRWLPGLVATPFAVPVLFDAYQIQLEHLLMADLLFAFLLTAAVTVVLWRRRLGWWTGALAGLLMSCAAVTRSVGLPLLLVLLVCMMARRAGWRAMAAAVIACAVPVLIYMSWFNSVHGEFAFSKSDNIWLYGRTVDFADCAQIRPRPEVAILCRENVPRDPRVAPAFAALWQPESGFRRLPGGIDDPRANELAGEFAWAAITKQPGDYVGVIVRDTFRAFAWEREPYPTPWTAAKYRFPEGASLRETDATWAFAYGRDTAVPRVVEPHGEWMRDYQSRFYVRGTVLGAFLLVGLGGMLIRVRRLGGPVLLPWSFSVALLVVPAATADFDDRYVLPAIPFAVLAAAMALIPERRGAEPSAPSAPEERSEPKREPVPERLAEAAETG
ncbi:hypothetical protein [Thermomonospora umbrina]|uniref:Dolichyl-phosphate-mannose-protein mannosyltransferase n=1 Tax=Thermomonospora umbrina TaxID=111806 RepID=A0A3D9T3K9_9ACTN|nr:hypothetical protein [Thermomonospora umbrina]REE98391.1 hypothetical protein DFJ69_3878 [Thermomonospora umbrina]